MNYSTHTRITRFAMALSAAAVTTLAACSDSTSPTALRSAGSTASFDHGGVSGSSGPGNGGSGNDHGNLNQGNLNQGDQNQGNQNQNDQRLRTIITLAAPSTGAPFAAAHGKAQLDTRVGETELELEVEHVPAGTVVTFFIGATRVGSATAGAFGEAELELNSRRGDIIPTITAGTVVSARTAAGAPIASGSF